MPATEILTLAELCRIADVTPRTVRYYIGQGLLPSPGAGPNARYTEGHLARLRLIRRLQREHLPLAEIRRRIEDMPDDQAVALEAASRDAGAAAPSDSAADYVRRLLAQPPRVVAAATSSPAPAATASPPSTASPPGASAAQASVVSAREASAAYASPSPPAHAERSTWERHAVAPDVEIHVRRPLDRHTSKQVERLIRIARDLLGDEG